MRATVCSCEASGLLANARVEGLRYCVGAATVEAVKAP